MTQTYNVTVDNGEEIDITVSDRIAEVLDPSGTLARRYDLTDVVTNVAKKYPNHGTFRLFESNPASQELTSEFLDSQWGEQYMAELTTPLESLILQKAIENPDVVQNILEEALEEGVTGSVEFGQFLLEQAQTHPEEVRTIVEIMILNT